MQNIKNKILKLAIYILGSFITFISFPLVSFAWGSGTNYFWATKAMFDNGTVQGDIIEDGSLTPWDEPQYMCYHGKGYNGSETNAYNGGKGNSGSSLYYSLNWDTGAIVSAVECPGMETAFNDTSPKPLSFPGIHGLDANVDDNHQSYAAKLNSILTNSFNIGLSMFVDSDGNFLTQQNLNSKKGQLLFLKAIAALGSNSSIKESMNETTLSITNPDNESQVFKATVSGITDGEAEKIIDKQRNFLKSLGIKEDAKTVKKYFLKVKAGTTGKYTIVQWAYPKGYGPGEALENPNVSSNDQYVPTLSWMHLSTSALSLYTQGIYSSSSGDLYSAQGTLTGAIVDFLGGLFTGVLSLVGAETIDELIFSTGSRSDYYFGIAPESWFTNLSLILIISYVVAITVLGIAFVKNFTMGNISILNPAAKANVMNGLMSVLYSILGLTIYIPVIGLLFALNRYITQFAYGMSNGVSFMSSLMGASSDLGGLIAAFVLMFLTIRINILYIIRSLYVVALYCLGPLFIAGAGFGNKSKSLFSNWSKEFIGQLFLQSFHAIILLIFIKMGSAGGILTKCVLAYSFLPLAKLFREKLLQLGGSDGDNYKGGKFMKSLGGSLATGAGSVAAGALGGATAASMSKKGKVNVPTAHESAKASVGALDNKGASSMKENDASSGSKEYSAGMTAGKGVLRGAGNLARGLGTLAIGAAVQAAGGNNKNIIETGSNLMSAGVGGMAGSVSGLRQYNKNKSQIEKNAGLVDSTVKTTGKDGSEKTFEGTYDSDMLNNQTYLDSEGKEHDMHASWGPAYDTHGNLQEGIEPSFEADLGAIYESGEKENPLYGLAQHCHDRGLYDTATAKEYVDANLADTGITIPQKRNAAGVLANQKKVAINLKSTDAEGYKVEKGSKQLRVSQKIEDGNINVVKASNILNSKLKK